MSKTTTGKRLTWPTILAVILVPLLVAGAFLGGLWNYDARVRQVQAAVVNLDEGTEIDGRTVPLGRQLTAALVDSEREQNFTWVLADESHAAAGLASGRYAAVVTIPENFSKAATSYSKDADEAHQAIIRVETSPVTGVADTALAQSIADAAAQSLNNQLTELYLDNIYIGFNKMGEQFQTVAEGARSLADGAGKLSDGISQASKGANELASGLDRAAAGGDKLVAGGKPLADGATKLADGGRQLSEGGAKLQKGLGDYADGVGTYADGADKYADGVGTYADGVGTYADGVKRYTDGVGTYVDGINGIVNPVIDLVELMPEFKGWLAEAKTWVDNLPDTASKLNAAVQELAKKLKELIKSIDGLSADAATLNSAVKDAQADVKKLANGTTSVACPASLKDVEGGCEAFDRGVQAGSGKALTAVTPLVGDSGDLASGLKGLEVDADEIVRWIDTVAGYAEQFAKDAPALRDQLKKLMDDMPADAPTDKQSLLDMLTQLRDGGNQLKNGGKDLAAGGAKLATGADQLAVGADGLADGADQLETGATQLETGAKQLTDGVKQLGTGLAAFGDGVKKYTDGVAAFNDGVGKAADGAGALAGGLGDAAKGSAALASGADKLADGLETGADQVPSYNKMERENLAKVVASPINTSGLDSLVTPQLALASLLLAGALWLGAMAAAAVRPPLPADVVLSSESTPRLFLRALGPSLAMVGAQAVLLAGVGQAVLRLPLGQFLPVALVLLVASAAFVAVNHALVAWLGNWGRLISLIMLLVTAVTALTFAAPAVFDALRPISPASPALDAIRQIATGRSPALSVLALIGWALLGLGAGLAALLRARTVPVKAVS